MPETASIGLRAPRLSARPSRPGLLRKLIEIQTRLSLRFDRLLPAEFAIDGNRDFIERLAPEHLERSMEVWDLGGGKNPLISGEIKDRLGLKVVGLDIDGSEMTSAPQGLYDRTVCADIVSYRGNQDADLVICQALLEHVSDVGGALRGMASILKTGGRALVFVPCRNAVYARINMALPELLKRRILFSIFPEMGRDHGFPAYYDRCTPALFTQVARAHELVCDELTVYFKSDYFRFCIPLHAVWRIWQLIFRSVAGAAAAETFAVVLRKAS